MHYVMFMYEVVMIWSCTPSRKWVMCVCIVVPASLKLLLRSRNLYKNLCIVFRGPGGYLHPLTGNPSFKKECR